MQGTSRTKRELLEEITALRRKIQEFEQSETTPGPAKGVMRESDERFRTLVEAASDWVWEIDGNGFYTYASPNIKDLLGYEPEDVIGKTPFDLMPRDSAGRAGAAFKKISESRQSFSGLENISIHRDGRKITLETNGVPVVDARGNYMGYRGFDRDITERKRTEEALRTIQIRLSVAMELAHIVYWEYDPAKSLILLNDSFYVFHGTTAEQEGGYRMTIEECAERFMYPDDRPRFLQVLNQNIKRRDAESVSDFEHRIIRRDGEVRHVLTRTRFFETGSDHSFRVYGATQDITDLKGAEEKEKRNERFSAALEMAGAICHELNQPLQVICSCVDLLSMESTDDRLDKTLEIINDQVHRMGTITKKLMGLKKYSNREYAGTIKIADIDQTTEGDANYERKKDPYRR